MDTLEYLLATQPKVCPNCDGKGYVNRPVYGLGGQQIAGVYNPVLCTCQLKDESKHTLEIRVTHREEKSDVFDAKE